MMAVQVQPDTSKVKAATKPMRSHGQDLPDWIRQERILPPLAGVFIADRRDTVRVQISTPELRLISVLSRITVYRHFRAKLCYCLFIAVLFLRCPSRVFQFRHAEFHLPDEIAQ